MTKKEIAKAIAEKMGLSQTEVKKIVQQVLDKIIETLLKERRIELRNFGVFEVKKRIARMRRNPRTGESVPVPSRLVVTFKAGMEVDQRINQLQPVASKG